MTLLSVHNLSVAFRVRSQLLSAVRGVDFSIDEGEMIGVVGESGCGKSALAKAICQLLPTHSTEILGEVFYKGEDISKFNKNQMRRIRGKEIGMIFQDPMTSLNPTMRIGNQIVEGYIHHHRETSHKEAKEYAIHLLELVGIPQARLRFDEYPHTLSGGMRQRVMIALALAPKPKLIIADEPTTALDVTIQAQILELMQQIKEKTKTSFIFITHDMSVVAGYCDRVLVMYMGKVIEKAGVDRLFAEPSHPYTQGLLKSIPRLDMPKDHPLIPIDGSPPSIYKKLRGCPFYERCGVALSHCKEVAPELKEYEKDHLVACWKKEYEATN